MKSEKREDCDKLNNEKILVIGLDAATFDIIDPLIERGRLPNISRLIKTGVRGNLRSTIPPLSPNAWTSFATGKNAGKHGIYSFTEQKSSSYGTRFVNSLSRRARPIWSILSASGNKVGVINMPITYPPDEVNGFMISGMDAPGTKSAFVYPPDLKKTLLEDFDYEIDYSFLGTDLDKKGKKILEKLYEIEKKRIDTARYMMDVYEWDFFFIVMMAVDRVQHFFWHCMEPSHPRYKDKGAHRFRNAVFDMYEKMDDLVGRIREGLDGHVTTFLMSDHGAGPFEDVVPYLNLNDWLSERSYLKMKKKDRVRMNWLMRVRESFRKKLPSGTKQWLKTIFPTFRESFQSHVYFSAIQWPETQAYAAYDEFMARGIRVNVKGREPEGTVEQGKEYERLRDRLCEEITAFRHPCTDVPIVSRVYKREELYTGEFVNKAPDLVVEWNDMAFFSGKRADGPELVTKKERYRLTDILRSGDHRPNGIFIADGPCIADGKEIAGAHIMDLAPTILYLMGQPVPEDMDGCVLSQIFNPSFIAKNPIEYRKTTEKTGKEVGETYSEKEAKKVEKRLKKLGYID